MKDKTPSKESLEAIRAANQNLSNRKHELPKHNRFDNLKFLADQKQKKENPPMPSKEKRYPKLTPEQIEISRQRMAEVSKMIMEGLHEDNKEIFGTDYLNKKA